MRHFSSTLAILAICCLIRCLSSQKEPLYDEIEVYTNTWAVEVDGSEEDARNLAKKHGFNFGRHLFQDYYTFKRSELQKRSEKNEQAEDIDRMLAAEPKIKWFEQQKERQHELLSSRFNDPRFYDQWYFNRYSGSTFDVLPAVWPTYTGKGVLVAVVDDGVDGTHPELSASYISSASYDFVDDDPEPVSWRRRRVTGHGNMCAGVIAGAANNGKCGVGVAYNAKIAGIRLYDQNAKSTDATESAALVYKLDKIDIYSNSWGPGDMGWRVEGPGTLTSRALEHGTNKGRGGLGSIYTFAAGNGGLTGDNCAYNGYVNSIYTIAINGVNQDGSRPSYAEQCPGVMATAYSRDATRGIGKVITADRYSGCTNRFAATSAATAMASGLIALTLEANPNLTWRDVQHIIARGSRAAPGGVYLKDGSWITNNAGFEVSKFYGFGLMNAWKMVNLAKRWTRVPSQLRCEIHGNDFDSSIPLAFSLRSHHCRIAFLEHVQVKVNLDFSRRGDLGLELIAPSGTVSPLTSKRSYDNLTGYKNLTDWVFMTLFHWGERNLDGEWTLRIKNLDAKYQNNGTLYRWSLILYGTETKPIEVTLPPKPTRPPPPPTTARPTMPKDCKDKAKWCSQYRSRCDINRYIKDLCSLTCGACTDCKDKAKWCSQYRSYCDRYRYMKDLCSLTCGACTDRKPIDGRFSHWGQWSSCTKTCGIGTRRRARLCNSPRPQNGGRECTGKMNDYQYCNVQRCPVCADSNSSWCFFNKRFCQSNTIVSYYCPVTCGKCRGHPFE